MLLPLLPKLLSEEDVLLLPEAELLSELERLKDVLDAEVLEEPDEDSPLLLSEAALKGCPKNHMTAGALF